jgi:hypothetical protein
MGASMSRNEAEALVSSYAPGLSLAAAFKAGQRRTHPDLNGGDHEEWHQLEEAAKVLGLLS